jgi:hypothetical protein
VEDRRRRGDDTHERRPKTPAMARVGRLGRPLAGAALALITLACGKGSDAGDSGGNATNTVSTGGNTQSESTGGAPGETGGAADVGSASDPFSAAEKCTSGRTWSSGQGPTMRPGEACISCHSANNGPRLAVAGTVYPTGHEPNDCEGAGDAGAVVVITDANGEVHELPVNQAGNFTLSGTLVLPYTARVVVGAAQRSMGSSQNTGDCNGCHTQSGSNGAPGRIVLPT